MKTIKNLWKKFISEENLNLAIQKAIKGKRERNSVIDFLNNLEERKKQIISMLETNSYPKHNYHSRIIYEGKQRTIYVIDFFPWRVIHHMIINIMEPIFEPTFIEHTYGCLKGRGQHKGSLQCQKLTNKYDYCLKCDIHKFYPSIDKDILMEQIRRKISDERFLTVIEELVYSHKEGIPIGNLPSQLFGNIFMSKLDYWVKNELRFKNYLRYVDDFLFFSNDKQELNDAKNKVLEYCNNELHITLSKDSVFKTKQGVDFLGYRHFKGYRLLRKRTATKLKRTIKHLNKAYDKKKKDIVQCISTIQSYLGWIEHCNSYNLKKSIDIEKVRQEITLKDFKLNGTTFISGKKVNSTNFIDKEIILIAFKIKHKKLEDKLVPAIQIMFDKENQTYYFESYSKTLIKQCTKIPIQELPLKATLRVKDKIVYLD